MDIEKCKQQALREIQEEEFRVEVDKYKSEFKNRKSFLDKIFPYKLIIIKKES